jgi:hypothetical protein
MLPLASDILTGKEIDLHALRFHCRISVVHRHYFAGEACVGQFGANNSIELNLALAKRGPNTLFTS